MTKIHYVDSQAYLLRSAQSIPTTKLRHNGINDANRMTITQMTSVIILILLMACSPAKDDTAQFLNKYYYNIDRFAGPGEVYVYQSAGSTALPEEIWHYRYDPGYKGNYLISTMYTPAGDVVQKTTERLDRDHAQLLSLDLYYLVDDSLHSIEAKVNSPRTFSFAAIDSLPMVNYEMEYYDLSSETDSVRVILNKTRRVVGKELFYFEGVEIPAVRVVTREVLETETEGFTESEWTGIEIFAQDIGMVYYKKDINEQFTLEYTLAERISYSQFHNRYGANELK